MKFPKIFLNHLIFNRRTVLPELERGPSGGLKELLTCDKCEGLLSVHNASFAISDLTTRT
jgi:hypothetical protein